MQKHLMTFLIFQLFTIIANIAAFVKISWYIVTQRMNCINLYFCLQNALFLSQFFVEGLYSLQEIVFRLPREHKHLYGVIAHFIVYNEIMNYFYKRCSLPASRTGNHQYSFILHFINLFLSHLQSANSASKFFLSILIRRYNSTNTTSMAMNKKSRWTVFSLRKIN